VHIARLTLHQFTSFKEANLDFAPGVNVIIGENATGKSHVLKLLYVLSESVRRHVGGEGLDGRKDEPLDTITRELLRGVFQPDELGRLVRRVPKGAKTSTVEVHWTNGASLRLTLTTQGSLKVTIDGDFSALENAVFIPTREVLSIYPGFTAAWLKRESEFDRTYYEICVQLGLNLLRGPRDETRRKLIEPLERATHARVHQENGRFYLKYDEGGDIEAQLAAEGHRKLGMIAYLVANGSLTANSFLFWDEPEAGINPMLVRATGEVIFGLAHIGLQSFLATHDYIFASDLSLRAAADTARFFAFSRTSDGVSIESGARLAELEHNPILDAFVDLHARERAAFLADEKDRPQ
jgi:energy-coupling factor transporter ATP-binding protein EcfA2